MRDSDGELGDLFVDAGETGSHRHVHELTLRVHLETTNDAGVHLVLNRESLTRVLGIGLQGCDHL